MPGNPWIVSLDQLTKDMREAPDDRRVQALGAVLQARVTLETANEQRELNEELVTATNELAQHTQGLVKATYWVAGVAASSAVVAAVAAVVAAAAGGK